MLPQVAIIDALGLNDYVIARNEATRAEQSDRPERQMAHDREAPEGYVECFRPNVVLENNYIVKVRPRRHPLTDDDIVECEARDWL